MNIGDIVRSTGFGPAETVGEIGIIIRPDARFPRTWIVRWNSGIITSYAQDGLVVLSSAA